MKSPPTLLYDLTLRLSSAVWGAVSAILGRPLLFVLLLPLVLLGLLFLYIYPYLERTLPYRNVPGPPPQSLLAGNFKEVRGAPPNEAQAGWMARWGPVIRYRWLFGKPYLCTTDVAALAHIAQHTYKFGKSPEVEYTLERLLGRGLVTVNGEQRKAMRRVMAPAFGAPAIKSMHDIFIDKAWELQRKLSGLVELGPDDTSVETSLTPAAEVDKVPGTRKVEISKYVMQLSLDVIGLAGFDYEFKALEGEKNELSDTLNHMLSVLARPSIIDILGIFIKPFRLIPSKTFKAIDEARALCLRVVEKEILAPKQALIQAELASGGEKAETLGRDLLSRVVRSNMDPELPADQRMTHDEMVAQVMTFMLAGNDTTATALTWGLWRLSENQEAPAKLRAEVMAVPTDRPSFDELNALPYLENVVHEILRLDPPIMSATRIAMEDVVLPLSKPVVGRDGKLMESVVVPKGTPVFIPILDVNRSKDIWGDDAEQFNPDRHARSGIPAKNVAGVYGNLLTFFAGARNCIGYRLSNAEIKACLFALMRNIEVLPLPSKPTVGSHPGIVTRPLIVEEKDVGAQMPLLLRNLD